MRYSDPYHDVSNTNIATIKKFEGDIDHVTKTTVRNYKTLLCYLGRFLGSTTFQNATKENFKQFFKETKLSDNSQQTMIATIKRFYKWLNTQHGKEETDPLPGSVRWIKFMSKREKQRNSDPEQDERKFVTDEEYQKLQSVAESKPHGKQILAWLEVLRLWGPRVGEMVSLDIKDAGKDDESTCITLHHSKTLPRKLPITKPAKNLMAWLDIHPYRGKDNAPLFVNFNTDRRVNLKRLSTHNVEETLKKLRRIAGIKKNITPHCFRHSAISQAVLFDDNPMPAHIASQFFGVSPEVINSTYLHRRNDALLQWQKKQLLKTGKLEPTANEIKNSYEQRLKSIEDKYNTLLDSEMIRGYLSTQQHIYEKQLIEEQQQDLELMEKYMRGLYKSPSFFPFFFFVVLLENY